MTALVMGAASLVAGAVHAQGGFQTLDPFYLGESAQHSFYGSLSVSGEVAFRDRDLLGLSAPGAPANDFAVAGRLDYALLSQVDIAAVMDLTGATVQGPLGLSWVIVKPYWSNGLSDYAIRLAVDPASEGSLGFRQTDVAFLSTTTLGPDVATDFAIGVRRVRTGYDAGVVDASFPSSFAVSPSMGRKRLIGQEIRLSWGYNVLFDPAGSAFSFGVQGEAGDYTLVDSGLPKPTSGADEGEGHIRSGIVWLRGGVEWNRPSFRVLPYISIPAVTWASVHGDPVRYGPRPEKARLGVRVVLR